eukprot:3246938-Pleurochrysis_carterae.AAC.1
MFRVVGQVDGGLVVEVQRGRVARIFAEFVKERSEVGCLLCSLGGCDDFSLTRRERDCGLLLAAPSYGGLSVHEHVSRRRVLRCPI